MVLITCCNDFNLGTYIFTYVYMIRNRNKKDKEVHQMYRFMHKNLHISITK